MEYVTKKLDLISFEVLSPVEIKKIAVAKIVTPELYDREGYPVDGGLMDIRMGVIDPGLRCKTCGGKLKECIGHFGFIDLARPVYHIKYIPPILTFLRATCNECGKILATNEKIAEHIKLKESLKNTKRVREHNKEIKLFIDSIKGVKKCPHCGVKQKKITIEKPSTFLEDGKKITPTQVRARLEKISDYDLSILNVNSSAFRPEWGVLNLLPVPPVTIRPSITLESGERSEDDLTHKLSDIVRINQRLFENINAGAPEIIIEDLWDLLQYHITTFFDNDISQLPTARHRSGQPLKTLSERIKSKEGRFRHNLAGKRVNFSARAVISPDPKLKFNEVGIPESVARELTIPERVTEWNIEWLNELVKKAPGEYPSANYVIRPDGKKKRITEETRESLLEELQPGYVVERHIINGDISIFNRQPSLHRMSIMCHKIKVLPGRSFRLNPAVCVAPDTSVQLSSGIQRPIDELKNCWKESELSTYDSKRNTITKTELKKFWGLKPEEYNAKCYEIATSSRKITATGDHPFYLKGSIKKASELKEGDLAIIRPLDTPVFEQIDKVLLTKEDIIKNSTKETYIKHTLKVLEDLRLIPLNLTDQRVMIISRLLGHLFGDGTFILKKDSGRMIFRGSKKDLVTIKQDIESLGFKPGKIYVKTTNNKIETIKGKILNIKGTGLDFEVRHKPLCILLASLGAPNGDKVKLRYSVPKWIIDAPKYIQREFLASYLGSEMTKPKIRKKSKSNFRSFVFKISKIKENLDYGREFIASIAKILKGFDINLNLNKIQDGNKRKDGHTTEALSASIDDELSKANFLGKIGYIYDYKKDNIARLAYHYMLLKQMQVSDRSNKNKLAKSLRQKNYKFKDISKKIDITVGMLENWIYRGHKAGIKNDFMAFDEWCKTAADVTNGFVYDKIISIRETYVPFVYDVTTTLDTHNFFANGFLSGNCTPYNADFDGDEMNLHIPQTEEARAEAKILMSVQYHIISPKNGLNIIGSIEDAVSGVYLLTKELSFSREEAIDLLINAGIFDSQKMIKFGKKVNGKEIFSAILPSDFDFVGQLRDGGLVKIKDGTLIEGVIDKSTVGEENGSLIRAIYSKYNEDLGIELLSKILKLGIATLLRVGFTTGISDSDLPEETIKKNKELVQEARDKVDELIEQYNKNDLEILPGNTLEETLELKISEVLNKVRDKISEQVAITVDKNNHTIIMAESGAKGSLLNLAMMAACVGQQAIAGKRIREGYNKRTLSIFKQKELSPESGGFIEQGYKSGLSPSGYFFSAMTGRDGLMDTALRTPKSGYFYRRLSSALQDLKIEYDQTLRDAEKRIIQFKYGEDGIDVSKSDGGTINVAKIIRQIRGK